MTNSTNHRRHHQKHDDDAQTSATTALRNREALYRLIISQLLYDGHSSVAASLASAIQADPPCAPSDRLFHCYLIGQEHELDSAEGTINATTARGLESITGICLDLEYETEYNVAAPEPALYETAYVTSHKGNCRAGCFSCDGQLIATGSVDASIKILDVDRMLAKSAPLDGCGDKTAGPVQPEPPPRYEQQGHPVIRTLYDHLDEVTTLEFHPKEAILVSGSKDCTVKVFDISKASVKKAYKTITECYPLKAIAFHPSGHHLLVTTHHPIIRMYDFNTSQCYVAANPAHQHTQTVTAVRWTLDGKMYVTCSRDGAIKLWDGVSSQCVNTFAKAHDGAEVCSVAFTRNGKYVLSAGKNSVCKLWELTTSRCLIAYTGAGTTGKQEREAQAVFNHTEDFVLFPDEASTSLCSWNARNACRKALLSLGHNGAVQLIVHSPTQAAFLTCSDDYRARFWYRRTPSI